MNLQVNQDTPLFFNPPTHYFRLYLVEYPKPTVETVRIKDSELYFYHFFGLSNNWDNRPDREPVANNDKIHVPDPLVATLARKAGLLDQ